MQYTIIVFPDFGDDFGKIIYMVHSKIFAFFDTLFEQ